MLLFAAIIWPLLAGLYLLLAGQADTDEIISAVTLSAATAAYACIAHARAHRRTRLPSGWPVAVLRAVRKIPPDAARVGWVLIRVLFRRPAHAAGACIDQPFRAGADTPADTAHRGIAILAASLAPNGYALHLEHDPDRLTLHTLAGTKPSRNREWPA